MARLGRSKPQKPIILRGLIAAGGGIVQSTGTISIVIGVAGQSGSTGFNSGSDINIAVAGVGASTATSVGTVGVNIGIAGQAGSQGAVSVVIADAGQSGSQGAVGVNIALAGAGASQAQSAGTIGADIAVAGVGTFSGVVASVGTIGLNVAASGGGAQSGGVDKGGIPLTKKQLARQRAALRKLEKEREEIWAENQANLDDIRESARKAAGLIRTENGVSVPPSASVANEEISYDEDDEVLELLLLNL